MVFSSIPGLAFPLSPHYRVKCATRKDVQLALTRPKRKQKHVARLRHNRWCDKTSKTHFLLENSDLLHLRVDLPVSLLSQTLCETKLMNDLFILSLIEASSLSSLALDFRNKPLTLYSAHSSLGCFPLLPFIQSIYVLLINYYQCHMR
jgi:hypothetical protein